MSSLFGGVVKNIVRAAVMEKTTPVQRDIAKEILSKVSNNTK